MIITKEMICKADACASSMPDLDAYIRLYGEDKDLKEIKRIILEEHPEWTYLLQWLMSKSIDFIKMGEHEICNEFRIVNNLGEIIYFDSLQNAKEVKKQEIINSIQHILNTINVLHEEKHENGDSTWHVEGIEQCSEDGFFQVFNTISGIYEQFTNKTLAFNRKNELKEEIINSHKVFVEQKIRNSLGDVGWLSV